MSNTRGKIPEGSVTPEKQLLHPEVYESFEFSTEGCAYSDSIFKSELDRFLNTTGNKGWEARAAMWLGDKSSTRMKWQSRCTELKGFYFLCLDMKSSGRG